MHIRISARRNMSKASGMRIRNKDTYLIALINQAWFFDSVWSLKLMPSSINFHAYYLFLLLLPERNLFISSLTLSSNNLRTRTFSKLRTSKFTLSYKMHCGLCSCALNLKRRENLQQRKRATRSWLFTRDIARSPFSRVISYYKSKYEDH